MDWQSLKAARRALGLTQSQMGAMLDTDAGTIRKMELPPDRSQHRPVAVRMARLIRAYLGGYRPPDWPKP